MISRVTAIGGGAALIVAVGVEVGFYPAIATWLFRTFTGEAGWDGSSLVYYQFFRVLPIALGFLTIFALALWLDLRRSSRPSVRVVVVAWIADALLLAASVVNYAKVGGLS